MNSFPNDRSTFGKIKNKIKNIDVSPGGIREHAIGLIGATRHYFMYMQSSMTVPQQVLILIIVVILVLSFFFWMKNNLFINRRTYLKDDRHFEIASIRDIISLEKVGKRTQFENIWDGRKELRINPQQIDQTFPNQFTYSAWFYFKPSNFMPSEKKDWRSVLIKGDPVSSGDQFRKMTPGIYLTPYKNNMICSINTSKGVNNGPVLGESLILENIPVNKWFQLVLVMQTRSLDAYVNGLLEKSITLTGSPVTNDDPLIKGYDGGFDGNIAYLYYVNTPLNPDNIYEIYLKEKDNIQSDFRTYLVNKLQANGKRSCPTSFII